MYPHRLSTRRFRHYRVDRLRVVEDRHTDGVEVGLHQRTEAPVTQTASDEQLAVSAAVGGEQYPSVVMAVAP